MSSICRAPVLTVAMLLPLAAAAQDEVSADSKSTGETISIPDESPPAEETELAADQESFHQGAPAPGETPPESAARATSSASGLGGLSAADQWALVTLAVGIVTVLGLIIGLKVNAFIALITAAIVVSLMAPGEWSGKIQRVATAFGSAAGSIGIVIAMAAVIGKCMLDSGAADRIVRAFLNLLGERRSPAALMGSGFVLAVPVFFDTVFYLLVPLARSLHRKTGRDYLKYIVAIAAGGAITHTLVPPTPGPLMMASNLGFDVGVMILVGGMVALPAAIAGLLFASFINRVMDVPMRQIGTEPEPEPLADDELPSLFASLLPVVLPVLMISTDTVLTTLADNEAPARLAVSDIQDWENLQSSIARDADADRPRPGGRVMQLLDQAAAKAQRSADLARSEEAKQQAGDALEKYHRASELLRRPPPYSDQEKQLLIDVLNGVVLPSKDFYTEEAFFGTRLGETAKDLASGDRVRMKKIVVERMNRALLESAYNREGQGTIAPHVWETPRRRAANLSSLFGNANLALLISAVIAMWMLFKQRGLTRESMARVVETSLMSGGVIILITAGGGAFGQMLKVANVGDAIRNMFQVSPVGDSSMVFLVLGFGIAAVLKIAQGSSTVAMITGSAMLAGIAAPDALGYHPVYLATAIGGGSLMGSWMNDSGFWIFAKMGGLTEVESLKAWTTLLLVLGLVSFGMTLLLANVLPLV